MKVLRTLALMTALATLAGGAVTSAQEPKAAKTQEKKKDEKKTVAQAGKVEIYEGKSGWRFRVKNGEDKTVAMATKGYEKKEDVLKELEYIKETLNKAKPTEVKE